MVATSLAAREPDRSQSAPLAVALLFAIVMAGMVLIILLSAGAVSDTQDEIKIERAEKAMTEMDSEMATVALGESDSQKLDLGSPSQQFAVDPSSGWIKVKWTGGTNPLPQTQLGEITFEQGQTTLAYQGGGVWKKTPGGGTTMVSPPEFHYRNRTLTLPLIVVGGNSKGFGSRAEIKRLSTTTEFPIAGTENPIESGQVTVIVQSEYYEAWGEYFETRTDGTVTYDHSANQVELDLTVPGETRKVKNAMVITGGGGGEFQIQSGKNSVIDSYNSSTVSPTLGPTTPPSTGGTADVRTDKDIQFDGNAKVSGNLTTTGEIYGWSGSPGPPYRIAKNLRYGEGSVSKTNCLSYVGGTCTKDSGATDFPSPIDAEVSTTISTLESNNDNAAEGCFSESNAVEFGGGCGNTVELNAGDYYTIQDLQVQGNEKLILNTTEGDIRIAVDDDKNIQFQSGGNVTVVGDGRVRIFGTKQYQIQGGSTKVWNRGWDAPQLWLFCSSNCQVQIQSSATFVGVIYAPSKPGASNAQVQIDGGNTEVYGAIVGGGQAQLKGQADIHFDNALKSSRAFERPTIPSVTFLHITVNEVKIGT